jgi:hypothetical protein
MTAYRRASDVLTTEVDFLPMSFATREVIVRALPGIDMTPAPPHKGDRDTPGTRLIFCQDGQRQIKIGVSARVQERVAQLQYIRQCRLLTAVPGTYELLRILLRHFGPWRLDGGWFEPCADLLQLIVDLKTHLRDMEGPLSHSLIPTDLAMQWAL